MQNQEWSEELKREIDVNNYPQWPNEVMLKILFGSYTRNKFNLKNNANVLDVGCFCGNNLLPFASKGGNCYGVDIHEDIVEKADYIFKQKGFNGNFSKGSNTLIPYPDATFDLLLSVNTIHYESSRQAVKEAILEFKRVLKPGGRLYLSTVGPNHDIKKKALKTEDNIYVIKDWDFRDGEKFHFFESKDDLSNLLEESFINVEVGEVTEELMQQTLGFFVVLAEKN